MDLHCIWPRGRYNIKAGRGTDLQMKYAAMKLEVEVIVFFEEVCGEYVNVLFKPVIIRICNLISR